MQDVKENTVDSYVKENSEDSDVRVKAAHCGVKENSDARGSLVTRTPPPYIRVHKDPITSNSAGIPLTVWVQM